MRGGLKGKHVQTSARLGSPNGQPVSSSGSPRAAARRRDHHVAPAAGNRHGRLGLVSLRGPGHDLVLAGGNARELEAPVVIRCGPSAGVGQRDPGAGERRAVLVGDGSSDAMKFLQGASRPVGLERAEGGGRSTNSKCTYYSSAAIGNATNAAADAFQRMHQTRSSTTDAADQEKALKDVGSMVRGMVGSQSNGLVLSLELETENAKAALAAFKLAMGMMTAGMEKSPALREDILGDEAIVGPLGSIFAFRKGDVAVTIDGRALPGGRDSEIAIAKRIAGKL